MLHNIVEFIWVSPLLDIPVSGTLDEYGIMLMLSCVPIICNCYLILVSVTELWLLTQDARFAFLIALSYTFFEDLLYKKG